MWLCQWLYKKVFFIDKLNIINISPNIGISNLYFITLLHCWRITAEEPSESIAIFHVSDFTEGVISIRVGNVDFLNQKISWYPAQASIHVSVFILGN